MTKPFRFGSSSFTIVDVPLPAVAVFSTRNLSHPLPRPKVNTRIVSAASFAYYMTDSGEPTEPSVSKKIRFLSVEISS